MPRRELLTPTERAGLLAFPNDESELIRLATLSAADVTFIRHHRGHHNRLGIAVQMQYLRFPGRVLLPAERPHPSVLGIVAAQVRAAPAAWDLYATRDETRREHLLELLRRLGKKQFTRTHYRTSVEFLLPLALQSTQGIVLARALTEELRGRGVLLPSIRVIEQLCAAALTRAQRATFRRLTAPLTDGHRAALDALLVVPKGESMSRLAWIRQPAGAPSANVILQHLARLHAVRAVGLSPDIGRDVHQNRLLRLVREGGQTAVFQLLDLEPERRYATLVAILIDATSTLTDAILELHERLMGRFFSKARHRYEQAFTSEGEVLHEKLRLFSQIGAAIVAARREHTDPYAAIEAIVPWDQFEASVAQAEELSRDEQFDPLVLVTDYFPTLRKYVPSFLATFEFRGAPSAHALLAGLDTLREMNASGARRVPADAPLGFVPPKWARAIGRGENIDRRFYEFCALSELSGRLRAGDVYVVGSRQFRDFDEYLLPASAFAAQHRDNRLGLAVPTSSKEYLEQRLADLREALDVTNQLTAADELTDARISARGLHVAPIEDDGPPEAKLLRAQAYGLLPRVKITDLLLEVDRWTGFTGQFTHLKSGAAPVDRNLLLTAVLADAFNLGLEKMAEACPGTSLAKLAWLVAWHIRDDTYSRALAELVNYQHRLPFAAHWGEGTTSSSDGQRFHSGGHGLASGFRNLKYGPEPGVLFYTHISDQYAPFHTKVIHANVRDATHVLDGLLYHESDLRIEEHYTDTAGFTDQVFGLCPILGYSFAPRIADLAEKRIYVPSKPSEWPALEPLIGGGLRLRLIEQHFPEILRLAASIKQGTVTASLILRKLAAYPRQNSLAVALRELGRIERTLFMLRYIRDPDIRHRISAGLAKGEARNALARAVFFNRLGEIRDRSYENQRYRASGLSLVTAAIVLWNTVYLERAIAALREHQPVDHTWLPHVAPIGWHHVALTGDYSWHANKRVAKGRFRPLRRQRQPESPLAEP
jgi:TnpA family transposase